jgi:hypothetical protein
MAIRVGASAEKAVATLQNATLERSRSGVRVA